MINNNEIESESPSQKIAATNVTTTDVSEPESALSVALEVGNEVTIAKAYPNMPGPRNPTIPTLYELMIAPSFDV